MLPELALGKIGLVNKIALALGQLPHRVWHRLEEVQRAEHSSIVGVRCLHRFLFGLSGIGIGCGSVLGTGGEILLR